MNKNDSHDNIYSSSTGNHDGWNGNDSDIEQWLQMLIIYRKNHGDIWKYYDGYIEI